MSTTMTIYRRVASGDLTPEQGADMMMPEKPSLIRRPLWMPKPLYVVLVVTGAVLLAPLLQSRERTN